MGKIKKKIFSKISILKSIKKNLECLDKKRSIFNKKINKMSTAYLNFLDSIQSVGMSAGVVEVEECGQVEEEEEGWGRLAAPRHTQTLVPPDPRIYYMYNGTM